MQSQLIIVLSGLLGVLYAENGGYHYSKPISGAIGGLSASLGHGILPHGLTLPAIQLGASHGLLKASGLTPSAIASIQSHLASHSSGLASSLPTAFTPGTASYAPGINPHLIASTAAPHTSRIVPIYTEHAGHSIASSVLGGAASHLPTIPPSLSAPISSAIASYAPQLFSASGSPIASAHGLLHSLPGPSLASHTYGIGSASTIGSVPLLTSHGLGIASSLNPIGPSIPAHASGLAPTIAAPIASLASIAASKHYGALSNFGASPIGGSPFTLGSNLGPYAGSLGSYSGGIGIGHEYGQLAHSIDPNAQIPLVNTQFFLHAAPKDHSEIIKTKHITVGRPQKNYRVVFIKAPSSSSANAQISVDVAPKEEKTVIYVLSQKQHDINVNSVVTPPQSIPSKPEVYFVKYKTPEEAIYAQQQIQAQYETLGGSVQTSDEGIAPITSVIGALGHGAIAEAAPTLPSFAHGAASFSPAIADLSATLAPTVNILGHHALANAGSPTVSTVPHGPIGIAPTIPDLSATLASNIGLLGQQSLAAATIPSIGHITTTIAPSLSTIEHGATTIAPPLSISNIGYGGLTSLATAHPTISHGAAAIASTIPTLAHASLGGAGNIFSTKGSYLQPRA